MDNLSEEKKKALEYFKYQIELAHKEVKKRQNDEFKGQGTLEDIAKMKYCNFKEILNLIEKQNKEIEAKDKTIDLMSEQLAGLGIYDNNKEETIILGDKEEVKEYFRNKVNLEIRV